MTDIVLLFDIWSLCSFPGTWWALSTCQLVCALILQNAHDQDQAHLVSRRDWLDAFLPLLELPYASLEMCYLRLEVLYFSVSVYEAAGGRNSTQDVPRQLPMDFYLFDP